MIELAPDYAFNPQACAYYEGFFAAQINILSTLVYIGLTFALFDIVLFFTKALCRKYFKKIDFG